MKEEKRYNPKVIPDRSYSSIKKNGKFKKKKTAKQLSLELP
jgi:hypothetical protein